MTQLSDHIHKTANELATTAEHYAATSKDYRSIVQQVMTMGGKAMITGNFNLMQARQMTSMMIAALALATANDVQPEKL